MGALVLSGLVVGCGSSEGKPDPIEDDGGADGSDADGSSDDAGQTKAPDPIKVPATGVKQADALITKDGGQVVTESGALKIPAGAIDEDVTVKVSQVDATDVKARQPEMLKTVSPATAFEPHGQMFKTSITATVFYEASSDDDLIVMRLDDENDTSWERVEATFEKGAAFFATDHFSIYTVGQCDPANDPQNFCRDIVSGTRDLNGLPDDLYVPFVPPEHFGDGEPEPEADAGSQTESDAGGGGGKIDAGSDPAPDAGVDPVEPDASASLPDAGTGSADGDTNDADASVRFPDAGPGGATGDAGSSGGDGDTNPPDGEADGGISFPDAGPGGHCGVCRPIYACQGDLPPDAGSGPAPGDLDAGAGPGGGASDAGAVSGGGGGFDAGVAPGFPDGGYYDEELDCPEEEWVMVGQECWEVQCPDDPCIENPEFCETPDGGDVCHGDAAMYCMEIESACKEDPNQPNCAECQELAIYCGADPCMIDPQSCAPGDGGVEDPCYSEEMALCREMQPYCEFEAPEGDPECMKCQQMIQECDSCGPDGCPTPGDGGVGGDPCFGPEMAMCREMESYCEFEAPEGDVQCQECQSLITYCSDGEPTDGGGMDPCNSPQAFECMEMQSACQEDPALPGCKECHDLALYCGATPCDLDPASCEPPPPPPDGGTSMDPCADVPMCLELMGGHCAQFPDEPVCGYCNEVLASCAQ